MATSAFAAASLLVWTGTDAGRVQRDPNQCFGWWQPVVFESDFCGEYKEVPAK